MSMNRPRPARSTSTSDAFATYGSEIPRGTPVHVGGVLLPPSLPNRLSLCLCVSRGSFLLGPSFARRAASPRSTAANFVASETRFGDNGLSVARTGSHVHCTTVPARPPTTGVACPPRGNPPGDVPRVTARGGIQRRRKYKPRRLRRCSSEGGDPVIDRCTQGLRA